MRNSRKPRQAVPILSLVSELELEVMYSCMVRQGREVKEEIGSLQANLRYGEARIKGCPCSSRATACTIRWCTRDTTGNTSTTWVTSSYTLLIDNVCTLHNILYSLSGDDINLYFKE